MKRRQWCLPEFVEEWASKGVCVTGKRGHQKFRFTLKNWIFKIIFGSEVRKEVAVILENYNVTLEMFCNRYLVIFELGPSFNFYVFFNSTMYLQWYSPCIISTP